MNSSTRQARIRQESIEFRQTHVNRVRIMLNTAGRVISLAEFE